MKRYTSLVLVALVLILSTGLTAQVLREWVARYDGTGNVNDVAEAIAVDLSGNVYVTGYSAAVSTYPYNYDYVTVKYNPAGVQQWVARYNGPGNDIDKAFDIAVDNSGNVYVTGVSIGSGTSTDITTIKYNSSGVQQWVARYNSSAGYDYGEAIAVDDAGNVYVTGYSGYSSGNYNYTTIKYNASGVQQWVASYNGPGNSDDEAESIVLDGSGNVYVTGESYGGSSTLTDYATVKYNSAGQQQWVARYNGPGNGVDRPYSLAADDSGNVYVTGGSALFGTSNYDYATVKYNSEGIQQWAVRYNGSGNGNDEASSIAVDASGNAFVTGFSVGPGTSTDYVTIKYNPSGVKQWEARTLKSGSEHANALALDNLGDVYVTGYRWTSGTSYDYRTIRYNNASGGTWWVVTYGGLTSGSEDVAYDIAVDASGNVYVTGSSGGYYNTDYATIKYSQKLYQPDNQIRNSDETAYVGDNTYNTDGTNQTKEQTVPRGSTAVYHIKIQNDANSPDSIKVTGTPGNASWTVRYFDSLTGGTEITSDVTGSGWSVNLAEGAFTEIRAEVTPGGSASSENPYEVLITSQSTSNFAKSDAVKAVTGVLPNDVAPVSIDAPADTAWSEYTYTPKATVANFSEDTSFTFDVACEFDSAGTIVYADTVTVTDLAGGDSIQVSFASWTAGGADGFSYTMTVTTLFEDDTKPANDTISKTVTAIWPPRDVAPVAIITPPDRVWAGCPHIPRAIVANFWEDPASFDVLCEFDSADVVIYSETATVSDLAGGDSVLVEFPSWSAGAIDEFTYLVTVTTLLAKDLTPENDTISKQVAALRAVPDLDIQDYAGNLSANTMELTGVPNSIVVGAYVMSNPDNWEKNVDLFDGPANVDLDLSYSCTNLSTYGGGWMISAANIDPDLNEVSALDLGKAEQNILQVYIPNKAHFETYVGKVTALGTAEDGSTDADEFTLKINVVVPKGGGKPSSFSGDPLASGNRLYWPNFGFGEQGFNLYRAESEEFTRLNTELMDYTEYTDYDVAAAVSYQYKLGLTMGSGNEILVGPLTLTSSENVGLPVLYQNWPNPWMEQTEISYFLPQDVSSLTLKVYDVSGKLVKTLASGAYESGYHSVVWDGTDERSLSVSSGVYFARFKAGDYVETARMVILR